MDLGYKAEETASPGKPMDNPRIMYPSINFNNKVPPELMDKEIGHICRVEVVLKITSKGMSEHGESKNEHLSADVTSMKYLGKAGKKNKDEYLKMNDKEREEYDRDQLKDDDD